MSEKAKRRKITTQDLAGRKGGTPIVGLVGYTAPIARAMDPEVDFILVGDSLAMTIYGESTTVGVDLDTMIRHGRAVVRACREACVVVDLSFGSYQESPEQAFRSAARVMMETGCDAVKLEGGEEMAETVDFLVRRGVPVMGHIGLTPQAINVLGGFKTQGRDEATVAKLLADGRALDQAGCFNMVVEGVVEAAGRQVTEAVKTPTIGIGASPACDGQILVIDDVIGLFLDFKPKFAKRYAEVLPTIQDAIRRYAEEVRERQFPTEEYLFGVKK